MPNLRKRKSEVNNNIQTTTDLSTEVSIKKFKVFSELKLKIEHW